MEMRNFRDDDYEAVCDFLIALNTENRLHINWNWARFEWMYGHPEFDWGSKESIGLWWDAGRIVGAAIYDMYFGEAFCGVLTGYEALYPDILDYAWQKLRDGNGLGIAIRDDDTKETALAEANGFIRAEQTETIMAIDLADASAISGLPEGFTLAEPDPAAEEKSLQWLFWQGFDHGCDRAEFEHNEQKASRPRKHFNRHLSLAAKDPDGEYAACCSVWYSEKTDYAYVEPVCTVPACRGKGLAGALLREALRRAAVLGAKQAYVISDNPFYGKLGFERAYRYSFYWKS